MISGPIFPKISEYRFWEFRNSKARHSKVSKVERSRKQQFRSFNVSKFQHFKISKFQKSQNFKHLGTDMFRQIQDMISSDLQNSIF